MAEARRALLEPLRPAGPSARRAGIAVGALLFTLVGVPSVHRIGTVGGPVSGARQTAEVARQAVAAESSSDRAAIGLGRFRVIAPEAGRSQRNDGRIRIAARGAAPGQMIRASMTAARADLGVATLQSNARGIVEDRMHLVPTARSAPARLLLHDAVRGHLLAEVTFTLEPGMPVSVMSPSGSRMYPASDHLSVFGTTLTDVETVTLRVRERNDNVIAERTLPATGSHPRWRSFATDIMLPLERSPQLLWLDVSWTGGPRAFAQRHLRVPIYVRSAREVP